MSIHNPQNLIGMGSILADEGDTLHPEVKYKRKKQLT
jgi:hypothetical protein